MATEAEAVTSAHDDALALAALSRTSAARGAAQRGTQGGLERGPSAPRALSARGEARRRAALITRMGEKRLLRQVLTEIERGLAELRG